MAGILFRLMIAHVFSAVIAVLALSPSVTMAGDFYKWTDENGEVHFADSPSVVPPKYRNKSENGKFAPRETSTVWEQSERADLSGDDRTANDAAPATKPAKGSGQTLTYTDANFEIQALKSGKLTLVEFWATWCGPCRRIAPTIEQLAAEFSGRVDIGKLDIDANKATAAKYRVNGIPTMIFFKNGAPVDRVTGVVSLENLRQMIQEKI